MSLSVKLNMKNILYLKYSSNTICYVRNHGQLRLYITFNKIDLRSTFLINFLYFRGLVISVEVCYFV